jgi:hypothetical protein
MKKKYIKFSEELLFTRDSNFVEKKCKPCVILTLKLKMRQIKAVVLKLCAAAH